MLYGIHSAEWDIVLSQKFRNVFSNACELFFAIFAKISDGSSHPHTHTHIYRRVLLLLLLLLLLLHVVMGTTRTSWILDVHRRHLFWNAHIMTFEGTQTGNKLRQGTVASLQALYTRWESHKLCLFFILTIPGSDLNLFPIYLVCRNLRSGMGEKVSIGFECVCAFVRCLSAFLFKTSESIIAYLITEDVGLAF